MDKVVEKVQIISSRERANFSQLSRILIDNDTLYQIDSHEIAPRMYVYKVYVLPNKNK